MDGSKLRLRIATPTKMLYDEDVDMIIMRTSEGDMGVLHGHEDLTVALGYGIMRVKNNGNEILFSILGGFVEIGPKTVTILSDAAERPDEIDTDRAVAAKERAERMLRGGINNDVDAKRASLALRRALVRIEASSYPLVGGKISVK